MRWIITGLFLLTFVAALEAGAMFVTVAHHNQAELTKIQQDRYVSVAISSYLSLGICLACCFLMYRADDLVPSLFAVGLLNILILAVDLPWILA